MELHVNYITPHEWYKDNIETGKIKYGLSTRFVLYIWKLWQEIDELCAKRKASSLDPRQPSLSYIIRQVNNLGLPTEYEIWYRCKSIVGIKGNLIPREPVFGYLHKMTIWFPDDFPSASSHKPIFTFITDIWHPNIRNIGCFKGHVFLNIKEDPTILSISECILTIERYLKYEIYNVSQNSEDKNVAKWVIEEGEPFGFVKFDQVFSNSFSDLRQNKVKQLNKKSCSITI